MLVTGTRILVSTLAEICRVDSDVLITQVLHYSTVYACIFSDLIGG